MAQWGFKEVYTLEDLSSALSFLVNQESFAPISYWIDQLRERVVAEMRNEKVALNPNLMAIEVGRMSMVDEIRRTLLQKRITAVDAPVEQKLATPKLKRKRAVKATIDPKTGLSIGALKYAKQNKISIPVREDVKQPVV